METPSIMIETIPVALDIKLQLRLEILPYYMYIHTCTNFNGFSTDFMMSDQCLVAQGYFCSEQVLSSPQFKHFGPTAYTYQAEFNENI